VTTGIKETRMYCYPRKVLNKKACLLFMSMLNTKPTSVTSILTYKKRNGMFSSSFYSWNHTFSAFFRLSPSNHICPLSCTGHHTIALWKMVVQRDLPNKFRVFITEQASTRTLPSLLCRLWQGKILFSKEKPHIVVSFILDFGSSKASSITIFTSRPRLFEMIICNLNGEFTYLSHDEFPSAQF